MLQDAHSAKIAAGFTAPIGDTTVIAGIADTWIYVHEIIGDLQAAGNVTVKAGSRTLATFTLDQGQGITLTDEPGNDNVPRFVCRPGEGLVLSVTGGSFVGAVDYSLRQ